MERGRGTESADTGVGHGRDLLIATAASAMEKETGTGVDFSIHHSQPGDGARLHWAVLCCSKGWHLVWPGNKKGAEEPEPAPCVMPRAHRQGFHQLMLDREVCVVLE